MIPVTVAVRHCEIDADLRDRAEVIVQRLAALTPFAREAVVVFDAASQAGQVEVRLHLAGGKFLVASAEATEHRTALDQVEGRLRRQLERPAARPRRKGRGASRA
jgi:ribosome-associated translation inhibitor RaiA